MNEVDECCIKDFCIQSQLSHDESTRCVFRNSQYCIIASSAHLIAWYSPPQRNAWDDTSPKSGNSTSPDTSIFSDSDDMSDLMGSLPLALDHGIFRSKDRMSVYNSIALMPSGLKRIRKIRSFDILSRERLVIAILTEDSRVIVFVDDVRDDATGTTTQRTFQVHLCARLSDLVSPNNVRIFPGTASTEGESMFITDGQSPQVREFRFQSSLCVNARKCPTVTSVAWFTETGLPVPNASRCSIEPGPALTIIGTTSNGDSHGTVRLIPSLPRNGWVSETFEISKIENSIHTGSAGLLFVNSDECFKIMHGLDMDFPLYIRGRAKQVRVLEVNDRTIVLALANRLIRSYELVGSVLTPLTWSVVSGVDSFEVCHYPGTNQQCMHVITQGEGEVNIIRISWTTGAASVMERFIAVESAMSMALGNGIAVYLDSTGQLLGSGARMVEILKFHENEKFKSLGLSEEYLILLTADGRLVIHSLFIPPQCSTSTRASELPVQTVRLPLSDGGSSRIQFYRGHSQSSLILTVGNAVIARRMDPYEGVQWSVFAAPIVRERCVIELASDCMYSLTNGQIDQHRIPPEILEYVCKPLRSDVWCLWHASTRFSADSTRTMLKNVSDVVFAEKFEQLETRSVDIAGRRYLLSAFFAREYADDFTLTTEDLLWAACSDSQPSLVDSVLSGVLSWDKVRGSGFPYWCSDNAKLKEVAELIQKSLLQEYMTEKDVVALGERIPIWLAVLGKQRLLASLFKQHGTSCASPVHTKVAEFLSLDFSDPQNASKAGKNAFELVRQKRFGMAVGVFLIGGFLREAIDVCCRQMNDVPLAVMLLKLDRI